MSKQSYFALRADPVPQRDWDNAHLINAMIDIHGDEPGFGYRFIADEIAAESGIAASEWRVAAVLPAEDLVDVLEEVRPEP